MVKVLNLATGQEQVYSCSPEQAVVCAYEQSKGNMNTWEYDFSQAKQATGGRVVYCGDFACKKE
jgi:hypothetical protein